MTVQAHNSAHNGQQKVSTTPLSAGSLFVCDAIPGPFYGVPWSGAETRAARKGPSTGAFSHSRTTSLCWTLEAEPLALPSLWSIALSNLTPSPKRPGTSVEAAIGPPPASSWGAYAHCEHELSKYRKKNLCRQANDNCKHCGCHERR